MKSSSKLKFIKIFALINFIGFFINGILYIFNIANGINFFFKSSYYIQGFSVILYIVFAIFLYKIIDFNNK
ncbi:hypothetical protein L8X32_06965, partial [Campylobacter lari]|nr:hypothetical protein [Campylobacter lari]